MPMYQYLAMTNVANFVTLKLSFTKGSHHNYSSWRAQMESLIESHDLVGFIDGTIQAPHTRPTESIHYETWRTDKVVKGWILATISGPKLIERVSKCNTTRESWLALENTFKQKQESESSHSEEDADELEGDEQLCVGVNVANLVSEKLWASGIGDNNYESWKIQMLYLITSHGLFKYLDMGLNGINVSVMKRDNVWIRNDAGVKGWIWGSITPQTASSLSWILLSTSGPTAAYIWCILEQYFGKKTIATSNGGRMKSVKESTVLHKAALHGDWEAAQEIFNQNPEAKTDWIDGNENMMVLHVAVQAGEKGVEFVRNLVNDLSADDLKYLIRDVRAGTALHMAAAVGNIQAAQILVEKNPSLCNERDEMNLYPAHIAARYAQREVLEFLIPMVVDEPPIGCDAQNLINYVIEAKFYDIAINLIDKYPRMVQAIRPPGNTPESPLIILTKKMNGCNPETSSKSWERFIFSVIKQCNATSYGRDDDIESQSETTYNWTRTVFPLNVYSILHKFIEFIVPELSKKINEYQQALQLLRTMCKAIESIDFALAESHFQEAIFIAAELGVQDVAEVIIDSFPGVIYSFSKPSGQHVFHKAILNRSLNVFNLIYDLTSHKTSSFSSDMEDSYLNNPLHLAAKLAPPHKLQETYGAALQMRHEMLWFQEVEDIVSPYCVERENNAGKTPKMVFAEEHKDLKIAGEKWMKETANSYVLVAVLISTVMFTGAITLPGGNDEKTGYPKLSKEVAFTVFAISDTISLTASISSLLSFLAILTSRYAEEDFLHSLPLKLLFGLASLFVSILSMMVSFIATMYLVFQEKKKWFLFPLLMYACVPVALFAVGQYRLLHVLIRSTYDRRIFRKKKKL